MPRLPNSGILPKVAARAARPGRRVRRRLAGRGAVRRPGFFQCDVDGIPVLGLMPPAAGEPLPVALWLPFLGGTKEHCEPGLRALARAGFLSLSLDPWRHGERVPARVRRTLPEEVFRAFRREMWPILGQTTLDAVRVLDWAHEHLRARGEVVAGGVSMGGDIAVALAGACPRITRVAAVVATPDWTRPGMRVLGDDSRVLAQGEADTYARWFYEQLDPLTHLDRYVRGPTIAFDCGGEDTHVPPDGARRFKDDLAALDADAGRRVHVRLHPGVGHVEGARGDSLIGSALAWLMGEEDSAEVPLRTGP